MSDRNERPQRGEPPRIAGEEGGRGDARRTERLSAGGDEWREREPVNPDWRSGRASGAHTARRGRAGLPISPQEFQLWLQAGGWRYAVGIAALLIILLIALLAYGRGDQREAGFPGEDQRAPTSFAGVGADSALTPIAQPTITPAPTAPPTPQFFTVTGTGELGLFLRSEPSASGQQLATLPDGMRVERIGEDVAGPDRVWRHVREPGGQEGWVAVDFLTPAP